MATREMSRRQKAVTIVPIALLSAAWTISLAGFGSADAAGGDGGGTLPDGTTVPSKAIEAPANVPVSGEIAPGVPNGDADSIAAGASTSGIPSAALSAYQRSAQIIDAADTSCHIPWELIAAIGRVESDHGRYAGNILGSNGISSPGIYGPVLDGQDGTQAVKDTDGGQLDQDTTWDRAVGPMQFIPSTWEVVKVDADGDGQRNPQDINDASLATAVYLCSGSDNLAKTAGQKAAVFRYNHSDAYVDLVLRIMQAYSTGDYTAVPDGLSGGQTFSYNSAAPLAGGSSKAKAKLSKKKLRASAAAPTSAAPSTAQSNESSSGGSNTTNSAPGSTKKPTSKTPVKTSTAPKVSNVPKQVASAVSSAAAPVVKAIGYAAALTVCKTQIANVTQPTVPIPIPGNAASVCASKLQSKTSTADATAAVPSSAAGLLAWLGL